MTPFCCSFGGAFQDTFKDWEPVVWTLTLDGAALGAEIKITHL